MNVLLKQLHSRRHLLFLDIEGTQFSHEMIAFGALKATLKPDGTILRSFKGIKHYVKAKNTIGNFVIKLTGITKEKLQQDGVSFKDALAAIKKYCGPHFSKMAFITFGTHDLRIIMQSQAHNPDADETIAKHIIKNHIDMSALLGQFIRDDKNNPLSLSNNLKVFERPFDGKAHDPLDDARNLMFLYKDFLARKGIVFNQYLHVLKNMRHLPEPIQYVIRQLIEDQAVSATEFKDRVREYLG